MRIAHWFLATGAAMQAMVSAIPLPLDGLTLADDFREIDVPNILTSNSVAVPISTLQMRAPCSSTVCKEVPISSPPVEEGILQTEQSHRRVITFSPADMEEGKGELLERRGAFGFGLGLLTKGVSKLFSKGMLKSMGTSIVTGAASTGIIAGAKKALKLRRRAEVDDSEPRWIARSLSSDADQLLWPRALNAQVAKGLFTTFKSVGGKYLRKTNVAAGHVAMLGMIPSIFEPSATEMLQKGRGEIPSGQPGVVQQPGAAPASVAPSTASITSSSTTSSIHKRSVDQVRKKEKMIMASPPDKPSFLPRSLQSSYEGAALVGRQEHGSVTTTALTPKKDGTFKKFTGRLGTAANYMFAWEGMKSMARLSKEAIKTAEVKLFPGKYPAHSMPSSPVASTITTVKGGTAAALTRRSLEEASANNNVSLLLKRSSGKSSGPSVGQVAGTVVTTLMLGSLLQQGYQSLKSNNQNLRMPPSQPYANPYMSLQSQQYANPYISYGPQLVSRQLQSDLEEEGHLLKRARVSDVAGMAITLGFGWTTLQDHGPPALRELKRLGSLGSQQIAKLIHPQSVYTGIPIRYQQRLQKRGTLSSTTADASNEDGSRLVRRSSRLLNHKFLFGHAMAITGTLVTAGMLAGLGSEYIDKGVAKLKVPSGGQQAAISPPPGIGYANVGYGPYLQRRSLLQVQRSEGVGTCLERHDLPHSEPLRREEDIESTLRKRNVHFRDIFQNAGKVLKESGKMLIKLL